MHKIRPIPRPRHQRGRIRARWWPATITRGAHHEHVQVLAANPAAAWDRLLLAHPDAEITVGAAS